MVTQLSEQRTVPAGALGRLQQAWLILAQAFALALLTLALLWSRVPVLQYRVFLGTLAILLFLAASVPALRRSPFASALGGIALATSCWLSADHTWNLPFFTDVDAVVPLMTPVMAGGALLLLLLGVIVRAGILRGGYSFGNGALAGAALLLISCLLCYLVINYIPAFRQLEYGIDRTQMSEMLAGILLFLPALWLGSTGIRHAGRWTFLPIGSVLVIAAFSLIWQLR